MVDPHDLAEDKQALCEFASTRYAVSKQSRFGFKPKAGQGKMSQVTAMIPYGDYLWIAQRCENEANIYTLSEWLELKHRKALDVRDQWARAYHEETDKIILGENVVSGEEITPITQTVSGELIPRASACRCPSTIDDPGTYMCAADYGGGIHKVNMETGEATFLARTATGRAHPHELAVIGDYVIMPGADWKDYGLWKYDGTTLTKVFDEVHVAVFSGPFEATRQCWAVGFDDKSSILRRTEDGDTWETFRLPKHKPHKEVEHGWFRTRCLEGLGVVADVHGCFYLLPSDLVTVYGTTKDRVVTPIGITPKQVHDFCSFAGLIALSGHGQRYVYAGRGYEYGTPWGSLDFYKPMELWNLRKPSGYGGVWKDTSVDTGETSDPFLVNGFDQKTIHLETDAATDFDIEVDPVGDGSWKTYDTVSFGGSGYDTYIMTGDAIWARIKSSDAVTATAWLNLR